MKQFPTSLFKHFSIIVFIACSLHACKNKDTMFEVVSSSHSNIEFTNTLYAKDTFNILYYLYYYNGGGVATGDINNDGLPDIYFAANNKAGNKLYLNKGNFEFEDITAKANVAGTSEWCTGVTMADVNADGWLDIYVSAVHGVRGLTGKNELFINNKNGTFTESAEKLGLNLQGFTTQSAFFDFDHDGDLDCFILNHSQKPHQNISDTSHRKDIHPLAGDKLLRNDVNTTGKFTDVTAAANISQSSLGYGLGLAVADLNNDGWEDIYVGNDFHENDYYYINNGNGTFTESGAKHFSHYSRFSMGNDAADYDNDGQLDIITVDMLPPDEKTLKTYGSDENLDIYNVKIRRNGYQDQYSRNVLQHNNGNAESFSDVALMQNIYATDWSWAPLMADFDNDGVKDLFISGGIVKRPVDLDYVRFISNLYNGVKAVDNTTEYDQQAIEKMPDGSSHPFIYKGDLQKGFSDVSEDWGTANMKGFFNGAAYADLDNDGDLDLVTNNINAKATLLRNNSKNNSYIKLSFRGDSLNTFGVGVKAYVFQKDSVQYQQLMLTRGFESAVEPRLHFGLGSKNVDSILVVWPDQKFQVIMQPKNGSMQIEKKNAGGQFVYGEHFRSKPLPVPDATAMTALNWQHKENPFIDFNRQYLIPHEQSTRGPKIAVADINKDGLSDFYVCGAKDQPGAMFVQTTGGKYQTLDANVFAQTQSSEDVDAVFFDANKDGYPDLYVVSGGNEFYEGDSLLADHLFINDTKGHFSLAPQSLPKLFANKTCATASDVDHDGDEDLFVGVGPNAKEYGIAQNSYLLLNDGTGKFSNAGESQIALSALGMVTSAVFADLNKDGWNDLIVTGEFMPVKIFTNNKGRFTSSDIPNSTGMWQTLYATDINNDGYTDILAGNWGQNCKLYAGKNGPVKLYVKDFDKNGSTEQILTYTLNDKEYTFLAKDELERSLPVLKKAYLTYSEVAGKTVDYMFYDLFKDYTELKAETLSSTSYMNNGNNAFTAVVLPASVQQGPVFSFARLGNGSFLTAGNFYGVLPYEGRYDALNPTCFSYDSKAKAFKTDFVMSTSLGEVRDIKTLTVAGNKKQLILARNNAAPAFYNLMK